MKDNYWEVSASPGRGSELDRLPRLLGIARINEKGESDRPDFQIDTAKARHLLNHLRFCLGIPKERHYAASAIQDLLPCKAFSSIARVGYLTRKSMNRFRNLPREMLGGGDRYKIVYTDVAVKSRCVGKWLISL
jgi:hypothetical protein